jgi:hypothetical protein
MSSIKSLSYRNWKQFKSDLNDDLFDGDEFRRGTFLFRGHKDAEWQLETSFDRWFNKNLSSTLDRTEIAASLLNGFKQECENLEIADVVFRDEIKLLALGQHYGLPTRLLDWTERPYIAAFFAYVDLVSDGSPCPHIAIWALDIRSKIWNKELGVGILDVPSVGNMRLRNQNGKFTLSRTPFRSLEEYATFCSSGTAEPLIKITLPASEARAALADIDSMGISHDRVFPEIIGSALAAKMRILLESAAATKRMSA